MHASKLLNGFEGGYITTNNPELARQLSLLRSYGFEGQDNCVIAGGLNAKLNEMHAAMALANLDELEQLVADNRARYNRYKAELASIPGIKLLTFEEGCRSGFKNIVVEIQEEWGIGRDETVAILNAENILARAYYSPPLHKKEMRYSHIHCTLHLTDKLAARFMLLPCGDFVTQDDISEIVSVLRFIQRYGSEIMERSLKASLG